MSFPNQLTVARTLAVPLVILLYAWDFADHYLWATAAFAVAMATDWLDGYWARRTEQHSDLGRLLDPVADKLLVLAALVMIVGAGVVPAWIVAAIVIRELLVSGLRLAALQRGVVMGARDLAKVKTGSQALAVVVGGLAAADIVSDDVALWIAVLALVLTWVSGLDYARVAPTVLRGRQPV